MSIRFAFSGPASTPGRHGVAARVQAPHVDAACRRLDDVLGAVMMAGVAFVGTALAVVEAMALAA